MKNPRAFRWGIIGCGLIAPRFYKSLEASGEGHGVAAASKSMRRAKRFQAESGIQKVYASYEAMLSNEQLDAVYIATTHNAHAENAQLCLEHGLPVLIEKAFTQNAGQAAALIATAQEKKLFAMEAMWVRFCPAAAKVRELLTAGTIGEVQRFEADFSVRMPPLSPKMMPWNRMYSPRLAGGALLDIGIYPIAYARMIFGQPPAKISSSAKMTWSGVDQVSQYTFEYPNGASAEMKSAFTETGSRNAVIIGTKGRIQIPCFYRADHLVLQTDGRPDERISCGQPTFEYQIRETHRCLREGLTESPLMPLSESLETMQTLDLIRAQWGMKYPNE